MAPEGWRSPEFEPDRRRRVPMVPLPSALLAGGLVVVVVAAMVSVASRAFFAPMAKERNPVEIAEVDAPPVPVGTPTTETTSMPDVDPSTTAPPPSSPAATEPPAVTPPSPSTPPPPTSVPPASTPPPVVPTSSSTTTTTRPADPPDVSTSTSTTTVPGLPRASRSEAQCPVTSLAVTSDRATVLVVNLRSTESVIVLNGGSLTVAPDGCRTVTVDASPADPLAAGDVIEVADGDLACTTRLEGEVIASATSYELQVVDSTIPCGEGSSPEVSIFEALLWRGI